MSKKSELWIAAGGDELTCRLSLHHDGERPHIRIVLNGTAMAHNAYVTDILLASVANATFAHAEIDVTEVAFFDGGHVNPYAIDCLLRVINAVVQGKRTVALSLSNGCVRDVLADVLGRTPAFRHSVFIQANDSSAPAWTVQDRTETLPMRVLPPPVIGRTPTATRRKTLTDFVAASSSCA